MIFTELSLPDSVPDEELSPNIHLALRIYSEAIFDEEYDLSNEDDQNEVLDRFDERLAYVATDEDHIIQGVANYYPEPGEDHGWIEGLATNAEARVGSFMVRSLVSLAGSQQRSAIELNSVHTATRFWLKQGFYDLWEDPKGKFIRMRRDLD